MKKILKIGILLGVILCSLQIVTTNVSALSKSKTKIINMDLENGVSPKKVVLKPIKYSNGETLYKGVQINIGGKKVRTIDKKFDYFSCSAFKLMNGKRYLYIIFEDEDGENFRSYLYKYSKNDNTFYQEVDVAGDIKNLSEDYYDIEYDEDDNYGTSENFYIDLKNVRKNKAEFTVTLNDYLLGKVAINAIYDTNKDNNLELSSNRFVVLSYENGKSSRATKFNPNKLRVFTAGEDFKVYSGSKKNKDQKVRKIYKGDKIVISKIFLDDDVRKYYIKDKGWFSNNSSDIWSYLEE